MTVLAPVSGPGTDRHRKRRKRGHSTFPSEKGKSRMSPFPLPCTNPSAVPPRGLQGRSCTRMPAALELWPAIVFSCSLSRHGGYCSSSRREAVRPALRRRWIIKRSGGPGSADIDRSTRSREQATGVHGDSLPPNTDRADRVTQVLEAWGTHALRRYYATQMIDAGVPVKP
jgi:hypothetical protein